MSEFKQTKLRLVAILLNILVLALCAVSTLSCFLSPLLEVKAKYVLKADTLRNMLKSQEELLDGIDLEEIVGDGVTLKISVSFAPTDCYRAAFGSNETKIVEKTIASNVDTVVDELTPTLNEIAEKIVRKTVRSNVNDVIRDQVKNILVASGTTDDEATARMEEVLEKAEITDEYIAAKTDALLDEIYAENATVDSVTDALFDTVEEVYGKLGETDDPAFQGDLTLSDEDKTAIREEITKTMQDLSLADEEGNLSTEDIAALILLNILKQKNDSSTDEGATEGTKPVAYRFVEAASETDEASEEERNVREELKEEIRTYVMNAIPENAVKAIAIALKIVGYVLIFTCFTWVYPVVKIFCKLVTKNPAIKFKLPILLGWIPALSFGVAPRIALSLLGNRKIKAFASVQEFLSAASLSVNTATWTTLAAALALIVLWIFYRPVRKKLKQMKDEN